MTIGIEEYKSMSPVKLLEIVNSNRKENGEPLEGFEARLKDLRIIANLIINKVDITVPLDPITAGAVAALKSFVNPPLPEQIRE
jgi:hypothetical protein